MSNERDTLPCPSNPEQDRPTVRVSADEQSDLLWWDAIISVETPRPAGLRPPPLPSIDLDIEVDVVFDSIQIAEAVVADAAPDTQRSRIAAVAERCNRSKN